MALGLPISVPVAGTARAGTVKCVNMPERQDVAAAAPRSDVCDTAAASQVSVLK